MNETTQRGNSAAAPPSRPLLIGSIVLYAACLLLDNFCVDNKCGDSLGLLTLIFGAFGTLTGHPANLTWLANPLLFLSWIFIANAWRVPAIAASAAALLVGASFMLAKTVIINESGYPSHVTGYALGYWLWLASMALAIAAAALIPSRTAATT